MLLASRTKRSSTPPFRGHITIDVPHPVPVVSENANAPKGQILEAVWSKYSNAQRVSSLHVYRHHERNHPGKENLLLFPAEE